MMRVA